MATPSIMIAVRAQCMRAAYVRVTAAMRAVAVTVWVVMMIVVMMIVVMVMVSAGTVVDVVGGQGFIQPGVHVELHAYARVKVLEECLQEHGNEQRPSKASATRLTHHQGSVQSSASDVAMVGRLQSPLYGFFAVYE